MKLRNKKTGEIGELVGGTGLAFIIRVYAVRSGDTPFVDYQYNSLAELNEEWEDVLDEEVWYLGEEIGNYTLPKEEARKITKKILAWKRLKDKGFRFRGYTDDSGDLFSCQVIRCSFNDFGKESRKDLDLLFGGDE